MNMEQTSLDLNALNRTNNELKRAIRHFIDAAPNAGPLAVQIQNIKNALKSNEAMFTFASLVEQYAKMKGNLDNIEYQNTKKSIKTLKSNIVKCAKKNLSTSQIEKISDVLTEIDNKRPIPSIMLALGVALDYLSEDLSTLRESSKVIVPDRDVTSNETGVVAHDIHLASKRLVKEVIAITGQLAKTYPNDKFIAEILKEASSIIDNKGSFFKSIDLLERSTNYLALLIQRERCAAEEMLNDIHANLVSVVNQSSAIEQLLSASKNTTDQAQDNMLCELKNMEVKARSIDTLEGMQSHIKQSVQLLSTVMNNYVDVQNQINQTNESTIKDLSYQVSNASTFVEKLEKQLDVAEETSLVDDLTSVGNRKGYVLKVNQERKNWLSSKQALSLLVIDVDKFKSINDSFGHSIGDQVLKSLGHTLKKNIRSSDYVARYGGEEFVIILPATDINKAIKITKKLREVINALKFELRKKNKVLKLTCSYGISCFTKENTNTIDVFNQADKALYKAKNDGRDTIIISHENKLTTIEQYQTN